jgi:hypothetical protein
VDGLDLALQTALVGMLGALIGVDFAGRLF